MFLLKCWSNNVIVRVFTIVCMFLWNCLCIFESVHVFTTRMHLDISEIKVNQRSCSTSSSIYLRKCSCFYESVDLITKLFMFLWKCWSNNESVHVFTIRMELEIWEALVNQRSCTTISSIYWQKSPCFYESSILLTRVFMFLWKCWSNNGIVHVLTIVLVFLWNRLRIH